MTHDTVVLSMGRRWGKTVLGLVLLVSFASEGAHVAWIVPEFKNGRALWRAVKRVLHDLEAAGLVQIRENDRTVDFDASIGGGFIGMYSGNDNADSIRSEAFHIVVLDEAARFTEEAWSDAIQPTLADYGGKALLISTPRGRNWFWREWLRGQDPEQTDCWSATAPTGANPLPLIQKAFRLAKQRVSDRTYRQEWLAEFVDDTGGVFHNVRACLAGSLLDAPERGHRYVMGVDLAKLADYTVCVVIDEKSRQVIAFERFNQESWPLQKQRIYDLARSWNNARVWLDATGVGDPIYDDLRHAQLLVQPYKLTNASKEQLIENAVIMVEQQQVHWPAQLVTLTNELEAYERERTASGLMRMNAPSGMHDDCVIAFALGCWPLGQASTFNLMGAIQQVTGYEASLTGSGGAKMLKKVI